MDTFSLELWGGVECTVNRVGDRFFDQMERNGHDRRDDDLERFAALGLKALRYPVLWERLAPEQAVVTDWSWTDRRLHRLRELGIRPIVGLVHHGSGPRRTNLLDPGFAEGLADFARQVAERYPWIEDYTPVNEPLTTARFSALYGHWYPHAHDDHSFARAFLHQCRAVVLSMRAIHGVNPAARLIQTEDLGKTFSTSVLATQAEFENTRRWLTFDLLCGRVDEAHPMSAYLQGAGITAGELGWFQENPCPPGLLGINHYITSERFLDERLERYPAYARAENGERVYADMPAVRASAQGVGGPGRLLREAWERYRLPLAVTEAQLNCTREEQMRWVTEIWRDARALRTEEGVDVRAVTLWALLGALNWTNLLTFDDPASYEPGAFDLRAPLPRPTALAGLARTFAGGADTDHPVLRVPGWWQRPGRFACAPAEACQSHPPSVRRFEIKDSLPAPLLVVGKGSALGHAFDVICKERALPSRLLDDRQIDMSDAALVRRSLDHVQPWAVIHATDEPRMDQADGDPVRWQRTNVTVPATLALVCAERNLPLLIFSSAQVFDGSSDAPYGEDAPTSPVGLHGMTSWEGEARVLSTLPTALVVRTGIRFGPWNDGNPIYPTLQGLVAGRAVNLPAGHIFSLAYLPDLVHACLDLLLDGEHGLWHLSNVGVLNQEAFMGCAAELLECQVPKAGLLAYDSSDDGCARRRNQALISRRAWLMPAWQSALKHLVDTHFPLLLKAHEGPRACR